MKGLLKDRVEGRIFVTRVCLGVVLTSRLSCGESFISGWWKPKGRDWYVVFLLEDLSRYKEWVQRKPLPTFAVCHVLLKQKWKWSRSVVSNSLRPMDCSLPGSSIHGIFRAKGTGVGCHFLLQGIFRCPPQIQFPYSDYDLSLSKTVFPFLSSLTSIVCLGA